MKRWIGLKKLVHDAVDHTTDLVEESHDLVAKKTLSYFGLFGPLGDAARLVDGVRQVTTAGVFASIHGVNRAVDVVTDAGISTFSPKESASDEGDVPCRSGEESVAPMRSDVVGRRDWFSDTAIGAVNGVIGDHLYETENGLDMGFSVRFGDRVLPDDLEAIASALPSEAGKLVVFVHGLCCTEWSWCLNAQEYYGDPSTNFGSQLQRDLGFTPLYIRYNTGRRIAQNGRLLSECLERLVAAASQTGDVKQLVLIGHSMGGLVIRSACHVAQREEKEWLETLTHVVCLGSPHLGAPLEKLGNAMSSVLRFFDVPGTVVPARLIDARSEGIKDLRHGVLFDDVDEGDEKVPLLDGVTYAFIAATVTKSAKNPLAMLLGDIMVRTPSALGPAESHDSFHIETHQVGGMHHLELQNHPDVYERIRALLADDAHFSPGAKKS